PAGDAGNIHRREFPALERAVTPVVEPFELRFLADVEPELEEVDAFGADHLLEARSFLQEMPVLLRRAEAHHRLDAGPVVPGAVERDELAGGRKMLDIA